jgi:hypothetical protein
MKGKLWLKPVATLLLSLLAGQVASSLPSCPVFAAESKLEDSNVGKAAPAFTLSDSNGVKRSLADNANKVVVLEWINFDDPYVMKQYSTGGMQKLQKTYTSKAKGVVWYSICSSAEGRQGNYPPSKINELLKQNNAAPTAYLFDVDGTVGRAYGARVTPFMFVINQKGIIVYSGAVDDNPSADISDKAGINYVQKALDETLANKPVSVSSTKAVGCSVHYRG